MLFEYPYQYWNNNYFPDNIVMSMLFLIPLLFFIQILRDSARRLSHTFVTAFSLLVLFSLESYSINKRFTHFDGNTLKMTFSNDESVQLKQRDIKRFWAVRVGRSGGHSCYLLVKMETGDDYRSMGREGRTGCTDDADWLNNKYRK